MGLKKYLGVVIYACLPELVQWRRDQAKRYNRALMEQGKTWENVGMDIVEEYRLLFIFNS